MCDVSICYQIVLKRKKLKLELERDECEVEKRDVIDFAARHSAHSIQLCVIISGGKQHIKLFCCYDLNREHRKRSRFFSRIESERLTVETQIDGRTIFSSLLTFDPCILCIKYFCSTSTQIITKISLYPIDLVHRHKGEIRLNISIYLWK